MNNIPSTFQKRTFWTAVTALSIAALGALLAGLIFLLARTLAFLQPLLVPFAVAGVLAYLLEPLVVRLMKWGMTRTKAVWLVFSAATVLFVTIILVLVPVGIRQGAQFARVLPEYTKAAREKVSDWAAKLDEHLRKNYGVDLSKTGAPSKPTIGTVAKEAAGAKPETKNEDLQDMLSGEWLDKELPTLINQFWHFIKSGIGGFLGVFGFLISFIIVPLYLYYFLTEAPKISQQWHDYVPLRASYFKDEVVGSLTEINRYLIAFFRGQLLVSMINGVATAIGLTILGLKFGWLIGLALCFLGIVPYVGIAMCWIPAVVIASVQGGSWIIHAEPWWGLPLAVTGVFVVVQKIDSFVISPRVVGESVGLHPMTVIASVFAWSLILGGLLGAILAVPMTAAVKVLFQRYVWQRAVVPRLTEGGLSS